MEEYEHHREPACQASFRGCQRRQGFCGQSGCIPSANAPCDPHNRPGGHSPMRIAVFGAAGSTGSKVVERALASGHEVAAIVRRPQAIAKATGLRGVSRRRARCRQPCRISRRCGVISCVGPAKNFSLGTVVSEGTSNIVAACQRAGVRRFVMQSGITLSEGDELSVGNRWAIRILRQIFSKACTDKAIAERAVEQSDLDWVIVRPSGLREAAPSSKYIAGPSVRIAPLAPLSFSDCADCLIRAATDLRGQGRSLTSGDRAHT